MKVEGKEIHVQGRLLRLARLAADGFEFVDDPEAMVTGLRSCGLRLDLFTFMQRLPHTSPTYHYPMEWDNLAAMPVFSFDYWWTREISDKTRNMVRRAEKKGVTVREVPFDDALLQGIFTIYNECPIRQGKPFAHYGKDIEVVRKDKATFSDRSVFIGAFLGDCLIGFAKLVSDEAGGQAALMQILSMIQHRDKAPTNALLAYAVRSCAERGIPYLVYSNFSHGKKQRDALSDFKFHNGFRRVDLPRYYVPLTHIGGVALRLRLHHDLSDHLPEAVLSRLRKLRHLWHNRRLTVKKAALQPVE